MVNPVVCIHIARLIFGRKRAFYSRKLASHLQTPVIHISAFCVFLCLKLHFRYAFIQCFGHFILPPGLISMVHGHTALDKTIDLTNGMHSTTRWCRPSFSTRRIVVEVGRKYRLLQV